MAEESELPPAAPQAEATQAEAPKDYGQAKFVFSFKTEDITLLETRVANKPSGAYSWKPENDEDEEGRRKYICTGCRQVSKKQKGSALAYVHVLNERVLENPDEPPVPHCCKPRKYTDMLASRMLAQMKLECWIKLNANTEFDIKQFYVDWEVGLAEVDEIKDLSEKQITYVLFKLKEGGFEELEEFIQFSKEQEAKALEVQEEGTTSPKPKRRRRNLDLDLGAQPDKDDVVIPEDDSPTSVNHFVRRSTRLRRTAQKSVRYDISNSDSEATSNEDSDDSMASISDVDYSPEKKRKRKARYGSSDDSDAVLFEEEGSSNGRRRRRRRQKNNENSTSPGSSSKRSRRETPCSSGSGNKENRGKSATPMRSTMMPPTQPFKSNILPAPTPQPIQDIVAKKPTPQQQQAPKAFVPPANPFVAPAPAIPVKVATKAVVAPAPAQNPPIPPKPRSEKFIDWKAVTNNPPIYFGSQVHQEKDDFSFSEDDFFLEPTIERN